MVAEVGQRSRRDVARVQLALEATARDMIGSARARIATEMHAALDLKMRTLVEDHGSLQVAAVCFFSMSISFACVGGTV